MTFYIKEITRHNNKEILPPQRTSTPPPPQAACATLAPAPQETRKDRVADLWLRLRREGYAPIAQRVYALLAATGSEQQTLARALLDDLPALGHELMLSAPLGDALAQELQRAYLSTLKEATFSTPPAATCAARENNGCRAKDPATCRVHGNANTKNKVGQTGNWKSLGLPAGRDIQGDTPVPNISADEAREIIRKGDTVKNPLGETLSIDEQTYKHINKKGRKQDEANARLREYPQMKSCVENPHEIWLDENNGRRKYIQFLELQGHKVINAVDEDESHILSWHSNTTRLDYYREGKLIYVRQ